MALENGADLVVELPFLVAVQSADHFAKGAVEILSRLGIDQLSFGTEEVIDYQAIATVYSGERGGNGSFLAKPSRRFILSTKDPKMWETFAGVEFTGDTPNHILGLAYAKACAGKGIALKAIQRQGAGYHSEEKRWPMLLRLVYAYTRKIRTLSLDSCPIANSFSRLHRYLGRIMTNCFVIKS